LGDSLTLFASESLEILEERFARGAITPEEFEQMKKVMQI